MTALTCISSPDWSDLPAELLVSITRFLPNYRFLFVLCSVNCRLRQLIQGVADTVTSGVSQRLVWRNLPLVRLSVFKLDGVNVDGIRVRRARRARVKIPHLLTSLRHVSALSLTVVPNRSSQHWTNDRLQHDCLLPLQCFDQLTSLILRLEYLPGNATRLLAPLLVTTLDSLGQLRCLELYQCKSLNCDALLTTLTRMCREQLRHVGLSNEWMKHVTSHNRAANNRQPRMPSIQSFRGTTGVYSYRDLLVAFPSLTHADCSRGCTFPANTQLSPLPSLMSFRIDPRRMYGTPLAHAALLTTLIVASSNQSLRGVCELINCTRALRQFATTALLGQPLPRYNDDIITTLKRPFASLTYLQLDGELHRPQWQYLLTLTAPPAFTATLTHLLLYCHQDDISFATSLLPNLPIIYRSLERCHIGLSLQVCGPNVAAELLSEWDAVVQTLRTMMAGMWCERRDEVVACRSDMVWRREAGVQYVNY